MIVAGYCCLYIQIITLLSPFLNKQSFPAYAQNYLFIYAAKNASCRVFALIFACTPLLSNYQLSQKAHGFIRGLSGRRQWQALVGIRYTLDLGLLFGSLLSDCIIPAESHQLNGLNYSIYEQNSRIRNKQMVCFVSHYLAIISKTIYKFTVSLITEIPRIIFDPGNFRKKRGGRRREKIKFMMSGYYPFYGTRRLFFFMASLYQYVIPL